MPPAKHTTGGLRSQAWWDNADNPEMSALYVERFLNYGLTPAELQSGRPIIGIAQTGNDLVPCNRHHLALADRVKAGIRDGGGIPLEFPVHPLQETGKRPTAALDRNLAYLGLVEVLYGYPLDGVVLTTGCDKTTPACLTAAATVNLPAIVLSGGPMLNGYHQGMRTGSGLVIWQSKRLLASGEIDYDEYRARVTASAPSVGHCNTMGTALSMNSLAEALGMSLPGCAAIPFGDVDIERAIIEGAGFRLHAAQCKTEDEVIEEGRHADGVLTQYARVGSRAIDAFTRCRVIARYGTGVEIVDVAAATRRGIQVTNAPNEWCAAEVADHAVALWLAAARKICEYDRATRRGEWHWKTGRPILRLRGRVFGLLSFGAIARLIAERARAFGVEVWAHDPFLDESEIRSHRGRPVSFDELVEGSDHLVIQAPLTPRTQHTFDRATLRRMKPTAVLVNTGRGPIVEDAALHQALTEGWIAGAALDDLAEEPAKQRDWRPGNPLLTLPNVIVTPHAAYYSEEAVGTVRRIAAEEAVRVLTGRPARSPVNHVPRSTT